MANHIIFVAMGLSFLTGATQAAKLTCPDTMEHRDVMATSAPEIKVKANLQDQGRQWADIIKPLTQKAISLAKAQRTSDMQEGIERSCPSSQIYVAQMVPVSNKPSGCDHRVLTRPAEEGRIWVQVVATCRYDWVCCNPDTKMLLKAPVSTQASEGSVGYTLEGPLAGNTTHSSTTTATSPARTK